MTTQAERDAKLGAAVRAVLATNQIYPSMLYGWSMGAGTGSFSSTFWRVLADALDAEAVPPVGEEAK